MKKSEMNWIFSKSIKIMYKLIYAYEQCINCLVCWSNLLACMYRVLREVFAARNHCSKTEPTRLDVWLDNVYHMRLLLLNARQVFLFVWFVKLFVVGTSFIQATFYLFSEFIGVEIGVASGNLKSLYNIYIYIYIIYKLNMYI